MKHFKKLSLGLLIVLLTTFSFNGYSQNRLSKKVDQFTSKTIIQTNDRTLISVFPLVGSKKPWDLDMNFMTIDKDISIAITHKSQSYSAAIEKIYFKFQDGSIIAKDGPGNSDDYNTGFGYSYTFTAFPLSEEELVKFASNDLELVKAYFISNPNCPVIEEVVKKKSVQNIKEDAKKLSEEYNSIVVVKKENPKIINYECKYEYDKVDDFTKTRTIITAPAILVDEDLAYARYYVSVSGTNINGLTGLRIISGVKITEKSISISPEKAKPILSFNRIDFLLENEQIVTLQDNEISEFRSNSNDLFSFKFFKFENDSIVDQLKSSVIKKVRLSINEKVTSTKDIDINCSNSAINVLNCIESKVLKNP